MAFEISRKAIDWREITLLLTWIAYFCFGLVIFLGQKFCSWWMRWCCSWWAPLFHAWSLNKRWLVNGSAITWSDFLLYARHALCAFCGNVSFGDSYPLQLTVLLFTPILYFRFLKELLPAKYAFIICMIMVTSVVQFLGMSYAIHTDTFLSLYGEGFAYSCLIGGLVLLLKGFSSRLTGIGCFSLFAITASIRPNLLIFLHAWVQFIFSVQLFQMHLEKANLLTC